MTDPKRARCYDKDWKYVPKVDSDIRKTFERIRAEQQAKAATNVCQLKKAKTA